MTDEESREILNRLQSGWKFLWGRDVPTGYGLRELHIKKTGVFTLRDTVVPADANSRSHSESKTFDTEQLLGFLQGLDFSETTARLRPPSKQA